MLQSTYLRISAALFSATTAMAVSAGAQAQETARPFSEPGHVVVSWDQPLINTSFTSNALPYSTSAFALQYVTAPNTTGSTTAFSVAPALAVFVAPHFSLGGQLLFGFVSTKSAASYYTSDTNTKNILTFGVAPEIGYDATLGEAWSLWLKASFAFYVNADGGSSPGVSVSGGNTASVGLYAPFLFHPGRHFFLGIGPDVSAAVASSNNAAKPITIGLQATFGGWLGHDSTAVGPRG